MTGWVYFVRDTADQTVKIGFTTSPSARLVALRCANGPLEVVATIPGTVSTEKWIQSRFSNDRLGGEWFSGSATLSDFMRPIGVHAAFLKEHRKSAKGAGRPATILHIPRYPQCPCVKCRKARSAKSATGGRR